MGCDRPGAINNQWKMTKKNKEYKFRLDGYLQANYDIILNEAIPNDWDGLFIIHGKEGTGKTTVGTQGCKYMDNDFCMDTVAFLPSQFENMIEKAKPGSSVIWDEAITGLNAAQWASYISQIIIKKLTQIRKKKLKIFICFPYLHMINKYIVSRCIASIYVFSKGFEDRGHAYFYNQEQTEDLYALMKEKYSMTPRKAIAKAEKAFYFKFNKHFCLPKAEYEKAKDKARKEQPNIDLWKDRFIVAAKMIKELNSLPELIKKLGKSKQYIYELVSQ